MRRAEPPRAYVLVMRAQLLDWAARLAREGGKRSLALDIVHEIKAILDKDIPLRTGQQTN